MKPNLEHSVERLAKSEEYRRIATGLGTTKQGLAVTRRHRGALADSIAKDRAHSHAKAVWRALRGVKDDDLALRLLVAGVSVCASNRLGADEDGNANFRDTALWLGSNLCPGESREIRFKIGAWGARLLDTLPIFAFVADDVLILTEPVHDLMDDVLVRAVRANPYLSPLTSPPGPWTQVRTGGLPKEHWARVPLIRERDRSIENAARKAIGIGRMQPVLNAVNYLQAVPFAINLPVLDFLLKAEPPDDLAALQVWEFDRSTAVAMTRGDFYVPLNLDFRGRIYGIPHFNFQREDHIRGLFQFADGEPIGEDGPLWLKAHVAARADGNDWSHVEKPSNFGFEERIKWTGDNLDLLRKIGNAVLNRDDPSPLDWALRSIDDKYQFLAACCELVQALDQGPDFITRLPLTFDATCSGLQHLCGMTRDEDGGRFVNLVASDEGDDFYRRVAHRIYMFGPDVADGFDECVAALMKGPFDRGIPKGPAMTYFYGSRAGGFSFSKKTGRWEPYGMTEQIVDVLKERGKPTGGAVDLARAIYTAIEDMVPRAKGVREFLEQLAGLAAEKGKPLRWITPLGMPVLNIYHPPDIKNLSVPVNGRRRSAKLTVGDKEGIATIDAVRAVTANFTHAADASHLQFTALACAGEGIPMVCVHDCFGAIAPRARRLNEIIREQFVQLHKRHNLLNDVLQSARRDLPGVELPPLPDIGSLEIEGVLKSFHAFK
jgi:DNA-directed RNA polymerase